MTLSRIAKDRWLMLLGLTILLLAVWFRLAYFNELGRNFPNFLENNPFCGLDANAYQSRAPRILASTWPDNTPFFHMILYPFYLAAVYAVVGINLKIAVIVQILLEVVACAAIYRVGQLTFNRATGLLASLFFALYGPLIFHTPCFTQVILTLPLYMLALLFLLRGQMTGRWTYFLGAGALTGLAALSRPTLFLLAPVGLVWLTLGRLPWRRWLWSSLTFVGIVFLVSLPVALHNYRTAGQFTPMPTSGWEILFLGNNPVAEGMGTIDDVLYTYLDVPGKQYKETIISAAKRGEDAYRQEVLKFVSTQSVNWLRLQGRKAYLLLWESDDRLISPYFLHNLQTIPLLTYLPFGWRSIFSGALLGILFLKYKYRNFLLLLLLAALLPSTLLFHIQFRFRLMFVPLLLLYTAALVANLPYLRGWRRWLILLLLASLYPLLPEVGWLLLFCIGAVLWPLIYHRDWRRLFWPALATWSYFVIATLLSQVIAFTGQTGQEQALFLGPPVAGPFALGQSFIAHCQGLNRVSVVLGTFGDTPRQPVTFHLRPAPDGDDIYHTTLDVTSVKDRSGYDIFFPSQVDSLGRSYFFFIEAPMTNQTQAITLRGTYDQPFNRYQEGNAYIGQSGAWQKLPADLAFHAACNFDALAMTRQTFQQLAANKFGSPTFYWGLLVVHGGLLLLAALKIKNWRNF